MTVSDWLESPYLSHVAARVTYQYGVASQENAELLQELRIALWKAGTETLVNATWVFHAATNKAQDLLRQRKRRARETSFSPDYQSVACTLNPELLRLLRARVALLPPRLREFYFLRYRAGYSERQIAERLGLCRSSIRCMERRCLRIVAGRSHRFPHPIRAAAGSRV